MHRILLLTLLGFISTQALARDCEVYGISDSPQKLVCQFPREKIELKCESGVYTMNGAKVVEAYHLEVEDGPSPMVFQNPETILTVIKESEKNIFAFLEAHSTKVKGTCFVP